MNQLVGATSLYLRQHAENPVDWWTWGDEAFAEARRRDVPVFLSIGYAACHWCHVMAHECFEDPTIAALLNVVALPIKVDREERPDVDALYMSATQAMTGRGGWPMSVFLTHDAAPFFAGTYFPPEPRHGQPSFPQVLTSVADVWANRRPELLAQAERLTRAAATEATLPDSLVPRGPALEGRARLAALVDALRGRFDPVDGGFSPAPKFPHPDWTEACLAHAWSTGDGDARSMATTTLDAMARGGLFDHVGGGFARYSVDAEWHVPHFEKMLCDQALLARTYLRAAAWLEQPTYAAVARRTLEFVLDELRVPGGFASSLDADAGGHEGTHVVLTASQVRVALESAGLAGLAARTVARYSLSDDGPLEGACVPRLAPGEPFRGDADDERVRALLLARRGTLARPAVDDKVLLEWNSMLASALAEASWRLGVPAFGQEARALVETLHRTHRHDGRWLRRSGPSAPLATCADVAWLLDAHVSLFELDGDPVALDRARELVDELVDGYWDGEQPTASRPDVGRGLFQSHRDQTALIVRAKDVLDGAVPSGSSAAAVALARLGRLTDDPSVLAIARRLVALGQALLDAEPHAAATLVDAACRLDDGLELVVPGPASELSDAVRRRVPPWSVVAFGAGPLALLDGRTDGRLYVCRGSVCDAPLDDVASVASALATAAGWKAGD